MHRMRPRILRKETVLMTTVSFANQGRLVEAEVLHRSRLEKLGDILDHQRLGQDNHGGHELT